MPRNTTFQKLISALCVCVLPIQGMSRTTSDIQIEVIGASEYPDQEFAGKCREFKPTLEQLIHYFDNAYPVEADFARLDRATPCYTAGTLSFNDGVSGEWVLYSGGTASFTFRRGDHVTFYYQHNSWYDPTNCTYGDDERKRC